MVKEQLISKLQELKQIKPRKDWVVLAKMNVLGSDATERKTVVKPAYNWTFSNILRLIYQRKLTYAFVVFLFISVGMFSIAQYTLPGDMLFSVKKITEQSQASLIGRSDVKNSFENLKKRSQDLAQAVKDNRENNISSAVKEVKDAASGLNNALAKNPALAKEVALEIKDNGTLLNMLGDFEGVDLKQTSDVLYKTIDSQIIDSLQETTLTESQQKMLEEAKKLYNEGDYSGALEKILLIE